MEKYLDKNEEKNCGPNQKYDLNNNENDYKQNEFKHDEENNGVDFILKESGIYSNKIEEERNPINKENEGVFPEIKQNQENFNIIYFNFPIRLVYAFFKIFKVYLKLIFILNSGWIL